MNTLIRAWLLSLLLCLGSRGVWAAETVLPPAKIAASFVILGDNQVGQEQASTNDASHANLAQLRQTLKDISTLEPKPAYIFFAGDLVDHGDEAAGQTIADRLEAWTKIYRQASQEFGLKIPVVPIPGNHEMMRVEFKDGKPLEASNPQTYVAWQKWLTSSGFGRFSGNGPTTAPPNLDQLAEDNSRITYSFDDADGNHFIVINTFTLNQQPEPPRGWIPYHWIAEDARKAQANPNVRHIFAFGHMPIRIAGFPFDATGDNSILNSETNPLARQLQDTFGQLSKFRGYFCGHLHLWDCSLLPESKEVWQVIAGNSGSKPILRSVGAWQAPFFFGFTVVQIHQDGRIGVVNYQRPIPDPYYSAAPQPPAIAQPEIFLPRKSGNPP